MTVRAPALAFLAALALGLQGCDAAFSDRVQDLDGNHVDPVADTAARITVALFVDSDCPVSNRYAPELERLHREYAPRGVKFWLVYPDPGISAAEIREHQRSFGYEMPALRDPGHDLVRRARALVTPEAAVFLPDGSLAYHGRIDNRYADLTLRRARATEHDLAMALDALLQGEAVDSAWNPAPGRSLASMSRPGVGCYIGDFK